MPLHCVVVPVFNEAVVLPELNKRLLKVLNALQVSFEIIYVDDGSTDATPAVLNSLRSIHPEVGVLRLSRNFGKEVALSAGLRASVGACVIVLDADLQDPPELIPRMLDAWRSGNDIVNMRRRSRAGETWFKKTSARLFYRGLGQLSSTPIPTDVGDFRLLSRRVVDALNALPERNRYMKGLFAWVGFPQTVLDYDRDARASGDSKQRLPRLYTLAIEGITSFSIVPLRLALVTGLTSAAAAFGLTLFYLVKAALFGETVAGFPTLVVAVLGLGGLNLLGLGIIGEYVGRTYLETKQRPLYLIDDFAEPFRRSRSTTGVGKKLRSSSPAATVASY